VAAATGGFKSSRNTRVPADFGFSFKIISKSNCLAHFSASSRPFSKKIP
jgi:hypothetical protein